MNERHNAQLAAKKFNEELERETLTQHALTISLMNSLLQHRQILTQKDEQLNAASNLVRTSVPRIIPVS